jgi:hypothetical protein
MSNGYAQDRVWSNRFLPEIKRILGGCLIGEAPQEEDQDRNTDLIVLRLESVRIGCRVRKFRYLSDYGHEFTVRSERGSGNKTELSKIIEGWGRYLFYGFCDEQEEGIAQWKLIDLNAFRLWFNSRCIQSKEIPGKLRNNPDGSSAFRCFDTRQMWPSLVFAHWASSEETEEPF